MAVGGATPVGDGWREVFDLQSIGHGGRGEIRVIDEVGAEGVSAGIEYDLSDG